MPASILICSALLGIHCSALPSKPTGSLLSYGLSRQDIDLMDQNTISSLLHAKEVKLYMVHYPNAEDGEMKSEARPLDTNETFYDNSVTINLIVSDLSDGKYHFYATSKWDKRPPNRGKDSFSICANGVTSVFPTANGYIADTCTVHVVN